jgi:hypothetical protein
MGRKFEIEDDDMDWQNLEKVAKNFKGSADDIEEIIYELGPKKKKKKQVGKYNLRDDF